MGDVLEMLFSDTFSWMKKSLIYIQISLKFVAKGQVDN